MVVLTYAMLGLTESWILRAPVVSDLPDYAIGNDIEVERKHWSTDECDKTKLRAISSQMSTDKRR